MLFGANNICDGSGGQQPPPAAVDAGDCVHYTAGATSVGLYGDPVTHTVCEPAAPPQATGGVAPQGPITVCCDA